MKAYETLSGNTPLIRIDYRLDGRPGSWPAPRRPARLCPASPSWR